MSESPDCTVCRLLDSGRPLSGPVMPLPPFFLLQILYLAFSFCCDDCHVMTVDWVLAMASFNLPRSLSIPSLQPPKVGYCSFHAVIYNSDSEGIRWAWEENPGWGEGHELEDHLIFDYKLSILIGKSRLVRPGARRGDNKVLSFSCSCRCYFPHGRFRVDWEGGWRHLPQEDASVSVPPFFF